MPPPTPLPLRQAIARRHQAGQTAAAIARALGLPPRTVRQLVRRDPATLAPAYQRCGRPLTPAARQRREQALALRREHPSWGAGLIRLRLLGPGAAPAERTVQRWFRRAGLTPAPAGRPATDRRRAGRPHAVWQVDAAERVRLRSGREVSWLRVVDECSGAVLSTTVFPPGAVAAGPCR